MDRIEKGYLLTFDHFCEAAYHLTLACPGDELIKVPGAFLIFKMNSKISTKKKYLLPYFEPTLYKIIRICRLLFSEIAMVGKSSVSILRKLRNIEPQFKKGRKQRGFFFQLSKSAWTTSTSVFMNRADKKINRCLIATIRSGTLSPSQTRTLLLGVASTSISVSLLVSPQSVDVHHRLHRSEKVRRKEDLCM